MMDTLRDSTKKSNEAYATTDRVKWVKEWPGQVVLCTDCIYFTSEMTEALKQNKVAAYEKKCFQQLESIVVLVRGEMTNPKMECKVCIVNSTLLYGFEYLGNTGRLVITP